MRVSALPRNPVWPVTCLAGLLLGLIVVPVPLAAVLLIVAAIAAFVVLTRPS